MRKKARRPLEVVTLRLFEDNVIELRRRCEVTGSPWQLQARLLIDEGIKKGRKVIQ